MKATPLRPGRPWRRARLAALTVVLATFAATGTQAQPTPPVPPAVPSGATTSLPNLEFDDGSFTVFSAFFENDVVPHIGRNEDRNYTYGIGLQASGTFIRKGHLDAPLKALDALSGMRRAHARSPRRFYTLMAFATGFTPDTLNTSAPVRDDRPYASIVGVSVRRLTVNDRTWDRAWSSELAIGVFGLDVVGDLQTKVHRWNRRRSGKETPYDPLGWSNQISHGGEPTALYRVAYERRLAGDESGPDVRKHWQVVGGGMASAGYYTNIALLSSARAGWFSSEFWEFSPGAMHNGNQNLGQGRRRRASWELFVYGGVRPRLVAYNAMMQGQFKDSVHTVTPRRLVAEWDGGLAAYVPFIRTQLVWQFAQGRSPEFEGSRRVHTWGSLLAVFSWPVKQP